MEGNRTGSLPLTKSSTPIPKSVTKAPSASKSASGNKPNGTSDKPHRRSPKFCIQHIPSEEDEITTGQHRQSLFVKFFNQTFSSLSGPSASEAMESHFERYLKKHVSKCSDDFDVRMRMLEQRFMGRLDLLSDKVADIETRLYHLEADKRMVGRLGGSQNGLTSSDVTSSISLSDRKNQIPSPNAISGVNPSRETTPSPTPNDFTDFLAMSPKIMRYGESYSPLSTPLVQRRSPKHEPSVAPSSEDDERVVVRSLSSSPLMMRPPSAKDTGRTKSFRIPPPDAVSENLVKLIQSEPSGVVEAPERRTSGLRRIETLQNDENEELDEATIIDPPDDEEDEDEGQDDDTAEPNCGLRPSNPTPGDRPIEEGENT